MAAQRIYLSQVLAEYRASGLSEHGPFFAVTYRKADGVFGRKARVCRRSGDNVVEKRDLVSIKTEVRRAGKLHLIDEGGNKFELHIPLLMSFNGRRIDHKF